MQPTGEGRNMAIATNRGIESWHRSGFEEGLIREVRSLLDAQRKEYTEDMDVLMRRIESELRVLRRKVDTTNGFYTWLIEVYPETVAQYKALMDLQKLGENNVTHE